MNSRVILYSDVICFQRLEDEVETLRVELCTTQVCLERQNQKLAERESELAAQLNQELSEKQKAEKRLSDLSNR